MSTEQLVRIFAGAFILLSLAFGVEGSPLFYSPHVLWFTVFVGANLFQFGFSKWCLMESILRKAGVKTAVELARGK